MKKLSRQTILLLALFLGFGIWVSPSLSLAQVHQHGTPSEKSKAPSPKTRVKPEQTPTSKPSVQEAAPTVEIPTEKQQLIGQKITSVALKPMQKIIRTVGRIEYDERRMATINTKFEGWIEKLYVDYTGRPVKKGEPLAEIYSPELLATQNEFLNALKWRNSAKGEGLSALLAKDAEIILEAAKQRLRLWDITEEQIRKIEETGRPIKTLTLYSPVSGTVLQKLAVQGMRFMPGEKLFDIADFSSVWVVADIYELDLSSVKIGEQAVISLSYLPGKEFISKIDYIYPTLSGETRTARIRFTLPNAGGRFKPQMFTDVTLKINLGKRMTVPEEAIIDTGLRQIVYVDKGDGNFEPREIQVGIKSDKMVEVLKGLRVGDRVATSANFLIDSEAKLKGIEPKK